MENKPIYCFKLDNETFELTRFEITDYKIHKLNEYGRFRYKWENPKINKCDRYYYLEPKKMDRFVNYKVFTFDPDEKNALRIIEETLSSQLDEFKTKTSKTQELLNIIKERRQ